MFKARLNAARDFFSKGMDTVAEVMQLATGTGRRTTLSLEPAEGHLGLSEVATARPPWRQAEFTVDAPPTAAGSKPLVVISFPRAAAGELESMSAFGFSKNGAAVAGPLRASGATLARRLNSGNPDVKEAATRLANAIYETDKNIDRVNFFIETVPKTKQAQVPFERHWISLLR
jgi:hypothetical protein